MQPQAQTQDQINSSLGSIYDPQTALIQQQQAALPETYDAQRSALEQAKVNAFRDISNTSAARGVTFSGFSPDQQAQYVGTKFLPAMAGLATDQQNKQFSLTQALNTLNANRGTQVQQLLAAQYANADKVQAAQIAAQAKLQAAAISANSKAAPAPTKAQLQQSAMSDIQYLFKGYNGQNGYTENTVIPQLQTAYPELTAQNIYDMVYPYRKSTFGN